MPTPKTGPKDVFGQLLAIVGLYVCVIAFGALLFGFINIYFPDVLSYDYGYYAAQSLKWPLAVLVIVFPLFIWWNTYIQRDIEKNPEKRDLRSRKWLLHFTLFAAAIVIVGDLVSLVFRFLNGDLTVQFVLKVLTVFAIAAVVFTYYLWNIRKEKPASKDPKMKWFVRIVVALGVFFIVYGFFTAGSPFAERMRRFDERRVQDLMSIQSQIIYYWQAKERLPQTIVELRVDILGFTPPSDPETGEAYIYKTSGPLEFELCAVFRTSNKESRSSGGSKTVLLPREFYPEPYSGNWSHDAGEGCFERTIDPELFPPLEKR